MSQDEEYTGSAHQEGSRPLPEGPEPRGKIRIPPPAFPPGERRSQIHRNLGNPERGFGGAFISPDEPMPARSPVPEDAFISPDEPIVRIGTVSPEELEADEVTVTGIGDDAHLDPRELVAGDDPYLMAVVDQVAKLAEALKRRGEAGLHVTPTMSRLEATLRAYCVGYLAGRRAENEVE